jgi:hypothetical protein
MALTFEKISQWESAAHTTLATLTSALSVAAASENAAAKSRYFGGSNDFSASFWSSYRQAGCVSLALRLSDTVNISLRHPPISLTMRHHIHTLSRAQGAVRVTLVQSIISRTNAFFCGSGYS